MANPNKKQSPKSMDIHKSLPPSQRVRSYQPHQTPKPLTASQRTLAKSQQDPPKEPKKTRKFGFKKAIALLLLLVLAAFIFVGVWDARNFSSAANKLFGSSDLVTLARGGGLKTDATGRVNVLIAGYSVDDPGHPAATLTDSILLLSMNPNTHTGYMLSIPRDLYVKIPGFGAAKINEAYQDGGVSLLKQIVETNFQTQVSYTVLVNYATVKDTVNALGGVGVNIQSPDARGLYDPNISPVDGGPLLLSNGAQNLNGQTALNLTRARGDAYGSYGFPQADFNRTEHQRQVFTAIKDKINWKIIINPRQNGQLFNAMGNNVKTDIKIGEVRGLFGLFSSIPSTQLKSLSLRELNGKNYLIGYTTPSGQSALVPSAGTYNYAQIATALKKN